jgi:uncharacterized protein involved in cysteine biosynthesis
VLLPSRGPPRTNRVPFPPAQIGVLSTQFPSFLQEHLPLPLQAVQLLLLLLLAATQFADLAEFVAALAERVEVFRERQSVLDLHLVAVVQDVPLRPLDVLAWYTSTR